MTRAPGDLVASIAELERVCEVGDWHPVSGRLHPNNRPSLCEDPEHEHYDLRTADGNVVRRLCTPLGGM